jgi:hypothetical protein
LRFSELALESNQPVWHQWDGDRAALLSTIVSLAQAETDCELKTQEARKRRFRQMWLLDRLAPEDNSQLLEPFAVESYGVYAWGRRLTPERRKELPELKVPVPNKAWERTRYLQFSLLAWCDSCPQDQIDSLLYWPDHWWPAMLPSDHGWMPSPVREFYRRYTEGSPKRRERMFSAIERYLSVLDHCNDAMRSNVLRYVLDVWLILLRDVAVENPSQEPQAPSSDDLTSLFESTLIESSFAKLAEIDRFLPDSPNRNRWAKWLWVWRHSDATWMDLHSYALWNHDEHVFDRLAEITPKDEMEAWDDLLINQPADNGEMRSFCKWIAPRYAEALRDHFQHNDRDSRTCAYLNYLSKASEPILKHHWRRVDEMPLWQTKLLDRRLFAPEPARPSDLLEERQLMIADPRLEDPFTS